MNNIDASKNGGHPLYLQDVDFLQNAYKEAFEGITSSLKEDSYILSGCIKTLQSAGVWAVSEGFVVLNREVFKVLAHTVSFLNENDPLYWNIQQKYVEPSPVLYYESGTQNVHIQRRAIVSTEMSDWIFTLPDVKVCLERLNHRKAGTLAAITSVIWSGEIGYIINAGTLYLYGTVYCNSGTEVQLKSPAINLPAEMSPPFHTDRWAGYIPPFTAPYSVSRNYIVMVNRIAVNSSGAILSIVPVTTEIFTDFSLPAPRNSQIRFLNPGTFPAGAFQLYFTFSVSWPIAPL